MSAEDLDEAMSSTVNDVRPNQIVKGKVLKVLEDGVVVIAWQHCCGTVSRPSHCG